MRRPPGSGLALLVVLAVIAALVAAIFVYQGVWGRRPPPLTASGPGVVRLTYENRRLPAPRQRVTLPDGTTVVLSMSGVDEEGGRLVGHVIAQPSEGPPTRLDLGEGETGTAGALSIRVLHLWHMPNPSNDAIDVQVFDG